MKDKKRRTAAQNCTKALIFLYIYNIGEFFDVVVVVLFFFFFYVLYRFMFSRHRRLSALLIVDEEKRERSDRNIISKE
jgi:hypothetical protein